MLAVHAKMIGPLGSHDNRAFTVGFIHRIENIHQASMLFTIQ